MTGTLVVVAGVSTVTVQATAGWGDSVYAVQAFAPENMTVVQGTLVQWRLANPTEPHTITGPAPGGSLAWDSSPNFNPPGPPPVLIVPGTTFNHTFSTAGTFTYLCKVHAYQVGSSWAGMVGTVIVEPAVVDTSGTLLSVSYAALAVAVVALLVGIYALVRKRKP
jgi:plastocyanin